MNFAAQTAARAGSGARAVAEAVRRIVERLVDELRQTLDLPRWRDATNWSERARAVSWPRAGVLAAIAILLIGGPYLAYVLSRPDAYPTPDPTARELAARRAALLNVSHTPPPSLVEANKSWKAE